MSKVSEFNAIVREYSDVADFVTVYIKEAHANDSLWPMTQSYNIKQQRELEERLEAAQTLSDVGIEGRLFVDSMDDLSCYVFGALPERLVLVERLNVKFVSAQGPIGYKLPEIEERLKILRK